jgi:hypothetical protein
VCEKHAIDGSHFCVEELFPQIGRGVYQYSGAAAIGEPVYEESASPATVLWI